MNALAGRFRCTEGQLYTAAIGFTVAVVLLVIGVPPVLGRGPVAARRGAVPIETAAGPAGTDPTTPPAVTTVPTSVVPRETSFSHSRRRTRSPANRAPSGAAWSRTPPEVPITTPLSIVDAGYTSSTSGTPLSGPEVPDDGMPVGVRLGRVDKMSFARLAGSGTVLHLRLVDDPLANQLVALAAVRACAITDPGWSLAEPGAPPEEAPSFDDQRCADGKQTSMGTWHFDLAPLGAVGGAAGVALVPVWEGPATFQVTFSDVALAAES